MSLLYCTKANSCVTTDQDNMRLMMPPRSAILRRVQALAVRPLSTAAAAPTPFNAYTRRNWLEENCGDVPTHPRVQDLEVSEMLRGGHALQVANARMLDAKLASAARGPATSFSATHTKTLEELKRVEEDGIKRVVDAVERKGYRFRPSATIPVVECSSLALGTFLSLFGENVSTSYLAGVKTATADYYNDQIREVYATKPNEAELKEMFKAARDEELVFVDAHTPDALDPAKEDADPVRKFAKNSTKILLQIATRV